MVETSHGTELEKKALTEEFILQGRWGRITREGRFQTDKGSKMGTRMSRTREQQLSPQGRACSPRAARHAPQRLPEEPETRQAGLDGRPTACLGRAALRFSSLRTGAATPAWDKKTKRTFQIPPFFESFTKSFRFYLLKTSNLFLSFSARSLPWSGLAPPATVGVSPWGLCLHASPLHT